MAGHGKKVRGSILEASGSGANIRLSFAGAALHPQLEPFGRLDQQISYFRGSREHWRNAVPTWSGLRYRDLYPGVDLELTGADGRLGPRLVAHSSADLAAVRLQIDGAQFTQNLQWIISAYFLERIGSTVTGSVSAVAVERAKAVAK